jgi:hypothetical protein
MQQQHLVLKNPLLELSIYGSSLTQPGEKVREEQVIDDQCDTIDGRGWIFGRSQTYIQ